MKREPIKTPFLAKAKDVDYQDSLALFKLILRFMNDNNLSGKKETVLGDYIVNKASFLPFLLTLLAELFISLRGENKKFEFFFLFFFRISK